MSGTASVSNAFTAVTTATGAQLDANFNSLVAYANDPTNRNNYSADSGTTATYALSFSPPLAGYTAGTEITFKTNTTNAGAMVVNANGLGTKSLVHTDGTNLVAGELPAGSVVKAVYDGTNFQVPNNTPVIFRSYLSGLGMSSSSNTVTISAGMAVDSTNIKVMSTTTAIAKTTGAWTAGNNQGGLDTGTAAASTWYTWYMINRPDTNVSDFIFSTSAATPTLPANYTLYRRIGGLKTSTATAWLTFTQVGDEFMWGASVLDLGSTSLADANAHTVSVSVAPGANVIWKGNVAMSGGASANNQVYITSVLNGDEAASATAAPLFNIEVNNVGIGEFGRLMFVMTDTAQHIRYRAVTAAAGTNLLIATTGWIDRRGRDS